MGKIRATTRLFLFLTLAIIYLVAYHIHTLFRKRTYELNGRYLASFARRMLKVLGVKIEMEGSFPKDKRTLLMPNHRSYLDPFLLMPLVNSIFVLKAEVTKWPLIGYGARLAKTIPVQRESKTSRAATVKAISERLDAGQNVMLFPEGTTSKGPGTKDFKPRMFHVSAEGHIPVLPVAIEYEHRDDAWVGSDTFIPHFMRCFSKAVTRVKVAVGEPMTHTDPQQLLQDTHQWLNDTLERFRSEWDGDNDEQPGVATI